MHTVHTQRQGARALRQAMRQASQDAAARQAAIDPDDPRSYLTLKQASALSGLSRRTLQTQINLGRLRAKRQARLYGMAGGEMLLIRRDELHRYLMTRPRTGRRNPLPPDYRPPRDIAS